MAVRPCVGAWPLRQGLPECRSNEVGESSLERLPARLTMAGNNIEMKRRVVQVLRAQTIASLAAARMGMASIKEYM